MDVVNSIKNFLINRLDKLKINRKLFAKNIGVSYHTICQIFHNRTNPSLVTIIKIASYFNCSIDEIIGRKKFIVQGEYKDLDILLDDWSISLRDFLKIQLSANNINPYKFSVHIGFDHETITKFLNDTNPNRSLNTAVIVAISEYFDKSIDELIGRVHK